MKKRHITFENMHTGIKKWKVEVGEKFSRFVKCARERSSHNTFIKITLCNVSTGSTIHHDHNNIILCCPKPLKES